MVYFFLNSFCSGIGSMSVLGPTLISNTLQVDDALQVDGAVTAETLLITGGATIATSLVVNGESALTTSTISEIIASSSVFLGTVLKVSSGSSSSSSYKLIDARTTAAVGGSVTVFNVDGSGNVFMQGQLAF